MCKTVNKILQAFRIITVWSRLLGLIMAILKMGSEMLLLYRQLEI